MKQSPTVFYSKANVSGLQALHRGVLKYLMSAEVDFMQERRVEVS